MLRNFNSIFNEPMKYKSINFEEKLQLFDDQWSPRVIAELNDNQFKIVKIQGEFVWHSHEETDEAFIVLEGDLQIEFRDGSVKIGAGEMFVIPRCVEHKPVVEQEVKMLLIEPRGVLNTGDLNLGELTAKNDVWI